MSGIPILAYHSLDDSGSVVSIPPADFAAQMSCLADRDLRGVCLREAAQHRAQSGTWPQRSVVITFDDGFANVHREAMPILKRHGFGATVFLVSDYVGKHNEWEEPPAGLGSRAIMTWAQVGDLVDAGWEIGAHTRTHPDLRRLSDERLEDEIVVSRTTIEERLSEKVESFAYPYGLFDARAERIVAREYAAGCSARLQCATDEASSRLPRVDAYYLRDRRTFARLLDGKLDGYLTLRRWGRRVRRALAGSVAGAGA